MTGDRKAASAALWSRYRSTGDSRARDLLVGDYIGLVHRAARDVIHPGARGVELGDLVGAGALGLIQAIEGFDPSRGFAFSSYAMPRIRGEIIDELHGQEPVPRSVRVRRRHIVRAEERLRQQLGASPGPSQMADALGIDLPTFWRWWDETHRSAAMTLDSGSKACSEAPHLLDFIPDEAAVDPPDALARAQLLDRVRQTLDRLPDRDRLVLTLYYYEELTLREIGLVLRVTEARVCQIHRRALRILRASIEP